MARKVLLLGATSAIAQATARLLAARGDRLFLVARDPARLEIVAADLELRADSTIPRLAADLDLCDQHGTILDEATAALDGLDTVIVAHGLLGDAEETQRDWNAAQAVMQTNFLGPASILTEAATRFEMQGRGVLVGISSVAGDRGRQSHYVYGAAKGGLSIFLAGLRNRMHSKGVKVITVKPGFVDTPMTAHMKKGLLFASPSTIARGIVRAIDRGADVAYLPWFWRWIMLVIRLIPEAIFKRLSM